MQNVGVKDFQTEATTELKLKKIVIQDAYGPLPYDISPDDKLFNTCDGESTDNNCCCC